ncbi:MAG: PAS domain-containing protein [Tepidimonas sp.]
MAVSGYTRDELLGQPHNIVRHPDMPEEAFRDMWLTILDMGRPWTGLVKNRRKNGDHYWVRANATPVREGDQIVGFLSVRTKPTEAEVAAAEALYARMRAEAERGRLRTRLEAGEVVRSGWLFALGRKLRPGLMGRILLAAATTGVLPVIGHVVDWPWWSDLLSIAVTLAVVAVLMEYAFMRPLQRSVRQAEHLAAR